MSTRFDPRQGLIVVNGSISGPSRNVELRLAIDTGATITLISHSMLMAAGYDPAGSSERVEVVTGSGVEYSSIVKLSAIRALGKRRRNLSVVAHTLPPSARIDGLIGLDLLRGHILRIDFVSGNVSLSS